MLQNRRTADSNSRGWAKPSPPRPPKANRDLPAGANPWPFRADGREEEGRERSADHVRERGSNRQRSERRPAAGSKGFREVVRTKDPASARSYDMH